ncbi:NACHT domain-containing protein [Saccharopolyspora sp. HNM0986]|uniref:UbiA family prenyltransferase n=1 Tax=Saccharopolyspora galaxeae TaxID=2781241 RepID=UPI0019091E9D|nr:UbiA family prenyltransferase [Saccharopolyspora sp. HNM0986]MBK0866867.1 NACHT domain-containing protein [Saccharopolyspora sp. HNM0986]
MPNRLTRTVRTLLLLGAGIAITLVLVPTAISIGTGGRLPDVLQPLADLLWPLAGAFVVFAAALALWERATNSDKPLIARRLNNTANRSRSVVDSEHYARERLKGSLGEHVRLSLELDELPPSMARPADRLLQPGNGKPSKLPADADLAATLDQAHGAMLVLGGPGAGKTTLLLELTRALARRAAADTGRAIPVVVDLGSWAMSGWRADERRPAPPGEFQKWLLREIERRYTIHPSLGRIWLEQGKLSLMLDGLDEVPADYRQRCVREINAVRDEFPIPELVVCCRDEHHEALTEPLELHTSVTVNPLTRRQIVEYFTRGGPRLDGVRTALRRDPELCGLLDTPLMCNVVALAFRDRPANELAVRGTDAQRRAKLIDEYFSAALSTGRGSELPYPPDRALRTLRFLARVSASPLCNDLTARTRLPTLVSWARFLPTTTVAHVFARGLPGLLAGATTGATLATGMLLGPAAGLIAVLVLVGYVLYMDYLATLPWLRPAGKVGTVPQGWITALGGYAFGLVVSLALSGLISPWTTALANAPNWVGVIAVVLVSFLVILGAVESWSRMPGNSATIGLLGTIGVGVLMFWTGPGELVKSIGIGLVLGICAGVATAARDEVWWAFTEEHYETFEHPAPALLRSSAPLVAVAGLVGVLPTLLLGRPFDVEALTAGVGLLIGGLSAPAVWHSDVFPFDTLKNAVSEWLGRALALTELPPRRYALLRGLAERSLLSKVDGGYRFTHLRLRDHLLGYEPKRNRAKPVATGAATDAESTSDSAEPVQGAEQAQADGGSKADSTEQAKPAQQPEAAEQSAQPKQAKQPKPAESSQGDSDAEPPKSTAPAL